MKRLVMSCGLFSILLAGGFASAQEYGSATTDEVASASEMQPITTPEMWFYQQNMRLYEDPKVAVRKKAEFRAQQRQQRIAAQKWYGFSNARPTVNATPWGGMYSPAWTASASRPYGWNNIGRPVIVHDSSQIFRR